MIGFKRSTAYLGIVLFCAMSLTVAWVAETFLGIKPCVLCLYLRYAMSAILCLSLIIYVYDIRWLKVLNFLCIASALALSFYHIGVEKHWWKGPAFCTEQSDGLSMFKDLSHDEKLERLRNQLLSKRVVRCDEINWSILGISVTIWNTLFLAVLLLGLGRLEWMKKTFIK